MMLQALLRLLAPYRALEERATLAAYQLDAVTRQKELLERDLVERPCLTLQDLSLTAVDQVSLKNLDEFQRVALFHAIEIIRLCNYEKPLREACIQVRDFLMAQTKNEKLNLLPHEKTESFQEIQAKIGEKAKKIPALPRSDSLYA